MDQLWIEPVGNIIIARVRGVLTVGLIRECHDRIVTLVKDTENGRILYDCLELEASTSADIPLSQWKLDEEIKDRVQLRRAIVVPNTKLAYLARLAFSGDDIRIFYNDMASALSWLSE